VRYGVLQVLQVLDVLDAFEVMRCVLLCILEVLEGRLCLLAVMRCVQVLCFASRVWSVWGFEISFPRVLTIRERTYGGAGDRVRVGPTKLRLHPTLHGLASDQSPR